MLLASHGENFGVSLVESLSMSRPVITTNKVNILRIEDSDAGFISNNIKTENIKNFLLLNKMKKK